jgi:DNA-binding NarL/FixJ family response regulator
VYRQILTEIQRGKSIDAIATTLDRREEAVRAMVESMVREGHVRDLSCEGDTCDVCPMSDSCSLVSDAPATYVISTDGLDYLTRTDEPDATEATAG